MSDVKELMKRLDCSNTPEAEALAFLINELVPEDRTRERVFRKLGSD